MRNCQARLMSDGSDDIAPETGSFRDRNNRVYYVHGTVVRGVSREALDRWDQIIEEPFFHKLLNQGAVVPTCLLKKTANPAAAVIK